MKFSDYTDSYVWDNREGDLEKCGIQNITNFNNYLAKVIRESNRFEDVRHGDIVRYLLVSKELDWIKEKRMPNKTPHNLG